MQDASQLFAPPPAQRKGGPSSSFRRQLIRRLIKVALCPVAILLLFPASATYAADGGVDPTFNPGGAGADSGIVAVAVQPDGKIIIAGDIRSYNGNPAVIVMRLNANGTPDQTFNAGGAGPNSGVSAIAIQSDGKIIIVGSFTSYNGNDAASDRIMRLNTDGTRDETFNVGGTGADNNVFAVAIQPDGKILIAGFFTGYNGDASASDRVMRLNADGSRDFTFNAGGSGADAGLFAIAVQPDGKILVGGFSSSYNGNAAASNRVMRLNSDGTLDATFNPGGTGANTRVSTVAVQPDGKIVIGGDFSFYNDDGAAPNNIMRLNADGTRDLNFNSGGTGTEGPVFSTVVQSNGKILVGGGGRFYNDDESATDWIKRLNRDGTLDESFNPGGTGANSVVQAVALQPDGKILIGGLFTSYNGDESVPDRMLRLLAETDTLQLLLEISGPLPNQVAAIDSFLFVRDPFRVRSIAEHWDLGADRNTRVTIFAVNLNPAEPASAVTLNVVDSNSQTHNIVAEDVRAVPDSSFTQIRFRLPDGLPAGNCLIAVKAQGRTSNTGIIRIAP